MQLGELGDVGVRRLKINTSGHMTGWHAKADFGVCLCVAVKFEVEINTILNVNAHI